MPSLARLHGLVRRGARLRLIALYSLLLLGGTADAQELSLLAGGAKQSGGTSDHSAWALEYREPLHEHLDVSLSGLNEGHLPGHHRDGLSLQAWGRTAVLAGRLSLAAGLGPYRYFDTTISPTGAGYADEHGWGLIGSLAATYHADGRWLYQLRINRIVTRNSIDTTGVMVGLGYQLEPVAGKGLQAAAPLAARTPGDEITALLGVTIVNSFQSESYAAGAIEYRHGLGRHMDVTLSLLDEGDPTLIRRRGVAAQIWGVREFLPGNRLELGIGIGPYVATDKRFVASNGGGDSKRSWIVSATAAYKLDSRWKARVTWNRVNTNYDRDTDLILFGVGYRF